MGNLDRNISQPLLSTIDDDTFSEHSNCDFWDSVYVYGGGNADNSRNPSILENTPDDRDHLQVQRFQGTEVAPLLFTVLGILVTLALIIRSLSSGRTAMRRHHTPATLIY